MMGLLMVIAMAEAEPQEPVSQPDIELLEFLGSWETASGEWLDPTVFADDAGEDEEPPETKQE
jgi:hypothetical protein